MKKQIRVDGEPPVTVLVERWDERWPTRWIAWGDPQLQFVTGPNAIRRFWNHGDGIFPSMGILRAGLSAQHGLDLEVRVSSPITSTKWQRLRVYTVLWLSPEPIQLTGEFRVRLGDESADTKILHGPLQVWTGVRTDIDWSRKP